MESCSSFSGMRAMRRGTQMHHLVRHHLIDARRTGVRCGEKRKRIAAAAGAAYAGRIRVRLRQRQDGHEKRSSPLFQYARCDCAMRLMQPPTLRRFASIRRANRQPGTATSIDHAKVAATKHAFAQIARNEFSPHLLMLQVGGRTSALRQPVDPDARWALSCTDAGLTIIDVADHMKVRGWKLWSIVVARLVARRFVRCGGPRDSGSTPLRSARWRSTRWPARCPA